MTLTRLFIATVSVISFSTAAFAQAPVSTGAVTKADIPALVKEAIMNDPEMIMLALEKLRTQKAEQAKKGASEALSQNKDAIFNNPATPAAGASAKDADVTVVEFFDYHCGYCKHFLPEVTKLINEDKKVRVLFVDFPILSEDSATAARAAVAVNRLNKAKYFEFHTALMNESGKFDEAKILEIAKKVGIKPDVLKAEMAKPEVAAALDKNRELAGKLNIGGTPGVIIGDEVVPGAMSYEELKKLVDAARAKAKPAQ